jgi:hypothetical protein
LSLPGLAEVVHGDIWAPKICLLTKREGVMSVSNVVILLSMTAGVFLAFLLVMRDIYYYVMRLHEWTHTLAFLMEAALWGALWLILIGFELMVRMRLGLVLERYEVVACLLLGGCAILGVHVLLFPSLDRYCGPDDAAP